MIVVCYLTKRLASLPHFIFVLKIDCTLFRRICYNWLPDVFNYENTLPMTKVKKKAVALISGGLDSLLATKVILDQENIEVEGINFFTGFCVEGHTHAIRQQHKDKQKRNNALWVAKQLGIKLHIIDIVEEYKEVLLNPKYGYGQNMNPCADCKIFMIKKAKQWLDENGFDFIITGEVIGQRPKSQRKDMMPLVAREAGMTDRLLRPLSAKNLPPTLPEREGWVDREKLHDFSGRSRKPQIQLAAHYGFVDYAQPAGGCCMLTDKSYSEKLVDMWQHRGTKEYELDDIVLLKIGRHLRPKENFKLIVGREEGENRYLSGYKYRFPYLHCLDHMGPVALFEGEAESEADFELAASIVARYGKAKDSEWVRVQIERKGEDPQILMVKPLGVDEVLPSWHV